MVSMRKSSYLNHLSEKVKAYREEKGWNQGELAKKTGLTQGAISQIENKKRMPSLLVLKKIGSVFNTSVEKLIGEPIYENVDEERLREFYERYQMIDELSEEKQKVVLDILKQLKS